MLSPTPAALARITDTQPVASSPVPVLCAWCPTFDRTDRRHQGASHGICPSCQAKLEGQGR